MSRGTKTVDFAISDSYRYRDPHVSEEHRYRDSDHHPCGHKLSDTLVFPIGFDIFATVMEGLDIPSSLCGILQLGTSFQSQFGNFGIEVGGTRDSAGTLGCDVEEGLTHCDSSQGCGHPCPVWWLRNPRMGGIVFRGFQGCGDAVGQHLLHIGTVFIRVVQCRTDFQGGLDDAQLLRGNNNFV